MPPTPPADAAVDPTGAPLALPDGVVRAAPAVAAVTAEHELLATLRDATPDATIVAIDSPQDLAMLLVERSCRALFLDLEIVGRAAETLVPHLARQFPDIPIVAVGTRADEPAIAPLVTTGEVYRFLHRPVSRERARTFIAAALRRADDLERLRPPPPPEPVVAAPAEATRTVEVARVPPPPRPTSRVPEESRRPRSNAHAFVFAATAVAVALYATAAWLSQRRTAPVETAVEAPVADPVGAANVAAGQGALLAPAGRNAADLFREAFARRPDDLEARVSLLNLSNAMLGAGERALVAGRLDEAAKAADTVAIVKPRDARVAALREQVARARAALPGSARVAQDDAEAVDGAGTGAPGSPAAPGREAAKPVIIPRPPGPNTDERAGFEDLRTVEAPADDRSGTSLAER